VKSHLVMLSWVLNIMTLSVMGEFPQVYAIERSMAVMNHLKVKIL